MRRGYVHRPRRIGVDPPNLEQHGVSLLHDRETNTWFHNRYLYEERVSEAITDLAKRWVKENT